MADALLFTYRAQRRYPPGIPTFGPARFFALQAQSSKIFGASKCLQKPFSPACGFEMEREGSESSNFACYMLHACNMRNSSSLSPLAPSRSRMLAKTLMEGFALSQPRRSLSSEPVERRIEQAQKSEFQGVSSLSPVSEQKCICHTTTIERGPCYICDRGRFSMPHLLREISLEAVGRGAIFHATYATWRCSTCSTPSRGPRGSWLGYVAHVACRMSIMALGSQAVAVHLRHPMLLAGTAVVCKQQDTTCCPGVALPCGSAAH